MSIITLELTKLVEELNSMNVARDQLIQNIQNLNGVAMYLRGKLPPDEKPVDEIPVNEPAKVGDELERSTEYPVNTT